MAGAAAAAAAHGGATAAALDELTASLVRKWEASFAQAYAFGEPSRLRAGSRHVL